MDTNINLKILGKISAAIGSTSLTLTEKKNDSESPPQHYRQRDNWNDGDSQPKPLFIQHHMYQGQPRSEENGKNPKPLEVYSNADLSTVQSFGTLPRRYKKSSSSSANSSCVTTIQARVRMLYRCPRRQYVIHYGNHISIYSHSYCRDPARKPRRLFHWRLTLMAINLTGVMTIKENL